MGLNINLWIGFKMNELTTGKQNDTMTSLELVVQINNARKEVSEKMGTKHVEYKHKSMMDKIREEIAVEEAMGAGQNILPGSYDDINGQTRPMYILPLARAKMLVAAQVPAVRIMVAKYIEALEAEIAKPQVISIDLMIEAYQEQKAIASKYKEKAVTLSVENKTQSAEIETMKPKAELYDAYMRDRTDIETPSDVGMILEQTGFPVSPYTMYKWLKDHKYCRKDKGDWIPTYKARHQGLMVVMDIQRPSTTEGTKTRKQGYITRKGFAKFYEIMSKEQIDEKLNAVQTNLFGGTE